MADKRTYIRVHDGMPEHPKVEPLSDKAFRVLIETWCWCSRNHTDGRISAASWAKRGTPKVRKELESAGLVEVQEGYVQVHDYLEHQRSADQIAAAVEKKKLGAALGNHRRWHVNGVTDPECEHCVAPTDPDPPDEPSHDRSDMRSVIRSDEVSVTDRFGSPEDRGQIREEEDSLRSSSSADPPRDDVDQLCAHLAEWIVRNGSKKPKISSSWRTAARLLLDSDGRDLIKAMALIDWCQQDTFWRANIQSMPTFRRQYDTLRLRANAQWEHEHRPPPGSSPTGSKRIDKAATALVPGDPLLAYLRGEETGSHLLVIEGGQTA